MSEKTSESETQSFDDKVEAYNPQPSSNVLSNSISRISSKLSGTFSRANDVEGQTEEAIFANHLQNAISNPQTIERIQSLARNLSGKTKKQLEKFEINNDDDFDLKLLLEYL
ncbi:hypothetical protein WICMUC_005128 [Wickerhamomyces mucosus]|uniref:Uncharacterized protein n=1 Tax=Wickerhamomyces mucosus TaxID=1378264 RepID=A0A9P8PAD4_9ASCO|nr:hypothetical protein WICMUC_005128 [Wickerhamomyces mucosus]